jgi:hypothetical protein
MSKILVVLGLAVLLGACSSLVPDQAVTNPFGLDGKSVTLQQSAALNENGLSAQAVSAVYSGSISTTFNDLDQSLPAGIRPSGISENVGVEADIRVAAPTTNEADFPNSMTIIASQLGFTVTDGSGQPTVQKTFNSEAGLNLTVTKKAGSCQAGTGLTCTYVANAVDTILLLAELVGPDFSTFFNIISGGTEPNTLSGTFSLTVSGDSLFPAGSQVTVVLNTSQGILTF